MNKESPNIRIIDIAEMAGVSVGTVDRVIHNRGRVSEENEKKVRAILEKANYQPNLMARSLASKKQYHFLAITLSFKPGEYWEAISEGIDKAASETELYNVNVNFFLTSTTTILLMQLCVPFLMKKILTVC